MTIGTHFFEFKPKELAAGQIHVYTMKFAHEGKLVEAQIAARLPHAEDGSPGGMEAWLRHFDTPGEYGMHLRNISRQFANAVADGSWKKP